MADTIHALATAPGKAGIAVIRVSGDAADRICRTLCGALPRPRVATLRDLRDADGALIDTGLVLRFGAGASFTGEPVIEFQVHGGPAIVRAVLAAIYATGLSRPAEAGAFTRRALNAGRMDLTQVHGLADALEAETELQRIAAMRRLSGATGNRFRAWRRTLVEVAARLEATIDFADEDLPDDILAGLADRLDAVADDLSSQIEGYAAARALRTGFEIAVIGPPNVGKSSLINMLSGRDTSIVSDVPGTTRDVVEARIDIAGIPVTFLDTAGLRDATDPVETLGIDRARTRARDADLRLHLSDEDNWQTRDLATPSDLFLRTKSDTASRVVSDAIPVSTRLPDGVDALLAALEATLSSKVHGLSEISRAYELESFRKGEHALRVAIACISNADVEIVLDEVYVGIRKLDQVVGTVDVENLLDEIFSSFCIGK